MNESEYENVFNFNKASKKYKIILTDAIKFLLSRQRVIEAKYHFLELERIGGSGVTVMELGFDIGVKTFDKSMVIKYDGLLDKHKKYKKDNLEMKRLIFWISINSMDNAKVCIKELLNSTTLSNDTLLQLYNLIHREFQDKELVDCADSVIKKRKLMLIRG